MRRLREREPEEYVRRVIIVTLALLLGSCSATDHHAAESDPESTGSIRLVVDGWRDVLGYQLLALVSGSDGLVGGAFWATVKEDPFQAIDLVHPPYWGDAYDDDPHPDGWGAGDFIWDKTAALAPGTYRVEFFANPGGLLPYGSHLPAEPIERRCDIEATVVAGQVTTVEIRAIPEGGGCVR